MAVAYFRNLHNLVFNKCNNFLSQGSSFDVCCKFVVDEYFVGLIQPHVLEYLTKYPNVFVFISQSKHGDKCLSLHPSLKTFNERSNAVSEVMLDLRRTSSFKTLAGWRNEDYGVYVHNREKVLFKIERSASSLLGITRYGVHINGYCYSPSRLEDSDITDNTNLEHDQFESLVQNTNVKSKHDISKNLYMWIAVRSLLKPTFPGLLDNMSAGGLTYGLDMVECARKECQEEASVPDDLLQNLNFVTRLSFIYEDDRGVCPEVQYCFDLELPSDFVPINSDGEVDNFKLVSIEEVKQLIFEDHFKPNSAIVVLDFLYRHRLIDLESDPRHDEIQSFMRTDLPFD